MTESDRIAFTLPDGTIRTEEVHGWSYRSGSPEIRATLTWWQQLIRQLTPRRRRKPIPVVRPATPPPPPSVKLHFEHDPDALRKAQKNMAQVLDAAKVLVGER